jgi:small-conductance mechanosensitive channel
MDNSSVKFWDGDEWKNRFLQETKGSKILWLTIILLIGFYIAMLTSSYFGDEGIMVLILVMMVGYFAYKKYFTKWMILSSERGEIISLKDYYEEKNLKEMFWILVNSKTVTGTENAVEALESLSVSNDEIYNALEELTAYNLNAKEFSKVVGALSVIEHPEIINLMQSLKSVYPAHIVWIYNLQNKKLKKLGFVDYQEYMIKHKKT